MRHMDGKGRTIRLQCFTFIIRWNVHIPGQTGSPIHWLLMCRHKCHFIFGQKYTWESHTQIVIVKVDILRGRGAYLSFTTVHYLGIWSYITKGCNLKQVHGAFAFFFASAVIKRAVAVFVCSKLQHLIYH